MNALSYILICGLLQVTVVATVGLVASGVCRRWLRTSAGAPLVASLASVVLLSLLAVSPWPSWLESESGPSMRPDVSDDAASNPMTTSNPVSTAAVQPDSPGILDTLAAGWNGLRSASVSNETLAAASPAETVSASRFTWLKLTGWILAAGVICGLIRLIGGLWSVTAFVRSGRRVTDPSLLYHVDLIRAELNCTSVVEIRESTRLETAATAGWRRPVILISDAWTTWTPEQIRSVLAHEIAHIRRGDFAAGVAAQVGLVLHFYHPLVHWLVNSLRLEQELAADALAAKTVGGAQRYLHAIGELALKQSKEPLGWPAQAFLPTRRTFLRRIEMLRDLKLLSGPASGMLRASSIVAVAAVTLLAAGLRPPGNSELPIAAAQDLLSATSALVPQRAPQSSEELEARYVPADAVLVVVARPAEIIALYRKVLAGMPGMGPGLGPGLGLGSSMGPGLWLGSGLGMGVSTPDGLSPRHEEMLTQFAECTHLVGVVTDPGQGQPQGPPPDQNGAVALTFTTKAARDAVAASIGGPGEYQKAKVLLVEFEIKDRTARFMPDDTTLIIGGLQAVQQMILTGPKSLSALTQTDAWHAAAKESAAVAVDATVVKRIMAQAPPNLIIGMFSPLWTSADTHTVGLQIGETTEVTLTSESPDEASANRVELTLNTGVSMLTSMIAPLKNSPDPVAGNALALALAPILDGHKLARNGKQVTLNVSGNFASLAGPLTSAMTSARTAAARTQQMNSMKQVLLALHNYHDTYRRFPPAVIIDEASGIPRSWRVEILPYLEHGDLYRQYRTNEPWDSEANRKVLAQMPSVFRHPSQPAGSTNTAVVAGYGKGLFFEEHDKNGREITEIRDGSSNTIAIVEANVEIPWTKPEEVVVYLSQEELPKFGFENAGFVAGLADGSVRLIPHSSDVTAVKAMFTHSGGEIVDVSNLTRPAVVPAPAVKP